MFKWGLKGKKVRFYLSDKEYYFSTDWKKLSNPKVWVDAAEQVFLFLKEKHPK